MGAAPLIDGNAASVDLELFFGVPELELLDEPTSEHSFQFLPIIEVFVEKSFPVATRSWDEERSPVAARKVDLPPLPKVAGMSIKIKTGKRSGRRGEKEERRERRERRGERQEEKRGESRKEKGERKKECR